MLLRSSYDYDHIIFLLFLVWFKCLNGCLLKVWRDGMYNYWVCFLLTLSKQVHQKEGYFFVF